MNNLQSLEPDLENLSEADLLKMVKENIIKIRDRLYKIEKLNNQLQAKYEMGCADWHTHEDIDDEIHEILAAIGD